MRIWVHFIKYDLDYAKYRFLGGLHKEKNPSFTVLSSATVLLQSTLTFDLKILNCIVDLGSSFSHNNIQTNEKTLLGLSLGHCS